MATVAQALKHVATRRVLAAFALLMVAEWALVAAVSIHAYEIHGALGVGLLGLRFIPAAGVGLVASRVLQGRPPALILRLVTGGRALTIAVAAGALAAESAYALVLVLVAVDGAIGALYRPAHSALLPSLVTTPRELTAAAGIAGNVKTLSQVVGAFAGGVALVATSPEAVAAATALLMATAALLVPHRAARASTVATVSAPAGGALRRAALNVAALSTLRSLLRGLWLAMVVVAAIELMAIGAEGVGILMAATAAGAIVAVPVTIGLFGSARLAVGLGTALAAAGAPLAALAAWHEPAIALALVALHGVGMAVAESAALGLLHRLLDARGVARLVGPMESAKLAFEGAGALLAPALLALAGTRGALMVAGLVPVVLIALDWRALGQIDRTAAERSRLVELLRQVDVFRPLTVAGLETIAARAERLSIPDGDAVIRQGEAGATFYVVDTGQGCVEIDGFAVGILGHGTGFGERALLRGGRRAATVRAVGDLEVVAVARDVFLTAVADGQQVLVESAQPLTRSLADLLPSLPLFARLSREALRAAAERFEFGDYPAGSELVRQGEQGDRFFVLLAGSADVLVDGERVGRLMPGDGFGEIALLHDVPRRATIEAREPVRVATLARSSFAELVPSLGVETATAA